MPANLRTVPHPGNPELFAIEVRNAAGTHSNYVTTRSGHTRPFRSRAEGDYAIQIMRNEPIVMINGNAYRIHEGQLQTGPRNADGSFSNHTEEWADVEPSAMDIACKLASDALLLLRGGLEA